MSFWSNFSVKAPAILAGAAGVSGVASVMFPGQTPLFQGLSTIFGLLGASLHSLNPASPSVPASVPVADISQQVPATAVIAPPVVPVVVTPAVVTATPDPLPDPVVAQAEQVVMGATQIAQIVQQTLQALKDAEVVAKQEANRG